MVIVYFTWGKGDKIRKWKKDGRYGRNFNQYYHNLCLATATRHNVSLLFPLNSFIRKKIPIFCE